MSKKESSSKPILKTPVLRKTNLWLFGAIMCIILIAWYLFALPHSWLETPKIQTYLSNKYHEDFIISDIKLVGAGYAEPGTWQAEASPAKDPSIKFTAEETQKGNLYSDQYIAALWTKSESTTMQPEIKNLFGSDKNIDISIKLITSGNLKNIATKTSPTFEQAIHQYPDELFYEIVMKSHESNSIAIHNSADKLYSLVQSLRTREIKTINLAYSLDDNGTMKYNNCSSKPAPFTLDSPEDIETCMKESRR